MPEVIRRIRPTPVDDYLDNPHRGCCTFQRFNGDELFAGTRWSEEGPTEFPQRKYERPAPEYLPTTVAYCRWFWRLMEPQRGRYDFSMIDRSLQVCDERGQTLAVRLMAHGSAHQPQVPDWYAQSCPMTENRQKRVPFMGPVYDAPEYFEHWGRFVREFAARYDEHPLLETIDVTYIGPWGEGAGECSPPQCRRFAELWAEAFVHTPRLGMIGGEQMKAAIATGAGWRCDCFGDQRFFGSPTVPHYLSWNHMFDAYPSSLVQCGARDAWRTGPVHFETCGVPMNWYRLNGDIDFVIQQGLKYHGTYFMPKSTALPPAWMDKLDAYCRQLGYRFVLRQATVSTRVPLGGRLHFEAWIENVGVAPIYRRYDFAVRLRQGNREAVIAFTDEDVRTWLPGDAYLQRDIPLPEGFDRGWVEVAAALVHPKTEQPSIDFAVRERFPDRWVDLGGFEIVAA
ncbi:MAG: hypothetical protein AMJ81_04515 [Phycisphaerae bacterium SM23_33]|nr:MAG: hypothetical protein AMJ81_04515 [Phycisphaerae bacterium SM23_33]